MTQRLHIAAGALLFAAGLLGCEDAGKKPVQARVPALATAPEAANAKQAPVELAPFPLLNPTRRHYVRLFPPFPPRKIHLFTKIHKHPSTQSPTFSTTHLRPTLYPPNIA